MLKTISVVIPLYNHEKYISQTIYGVVSQYYKVQEIIVIDDGSSDNGPAIVEELAKAIPEIIFWKQKNRGAHHTINSGIRRATSDLVAILNSDDVYHPGRFQAAVEAFEVDSDLDVVFTTMDFIDDDNNSIDNPWFEQALSYFHETGDLGRTLINGNIFVTTSNLIARRDLFDTLGAFSDLRYAHDLDFFLRLVESGKRIRVIESPLLSYRMHQTNTISEGHNKVKLEWAAVTAFYLSRLATRLGGWPLVEPYLEVLKRHDLLSPVMILFGYFMRNPSRTLEGHVYHEDEEIKAVVRGVIR